MSINKKIVFVVVVVVTDAAACAAAEAAAVSLYGLAAPSYLWLRRQRNV